MKIQDDPPLHLTYCLNVHRGEAWEDCLAAIGRYALKVRDRVGRGRAFGLGLRLGHLAANQLSRPAARKAFKEFLQEENLYVFTVNAFPYGQFHQTAVKENVYSPDWRTAERRDYTNLVADILADLLPEGVDGSISTVPGSYKAWITSQADTTAMRQGIAQSLMHLEAIHRRTGKRICLALEPEPDCVVETTGEVVEFIHAMMAPGMDASLLSYLGVCFDTSHMAVEFEDLADSLSQLAAANVPVAKIHLSSALRVSPTPAAMERLRAFCDPVYLHQVKATVGGRVVSYRDLPDALAAAGETPMEEMRVHFHVPLYFLTHAGLHSTSSLLTGRFGELVRGGISPHLEIETYTFDVLPGELKTPDIAESIAREFEWVLANVTPRVKRQGRADR